MARLLRHFIQFWVGTDTPVAGRPEFRWRIAAAKAQAKDDEAWG